ncbi:hypothetical protein MPTK1_5g21610 [Marchantia polymorpha subsp. ruderalis]|uniref:RING-type domain-containing protein n=2 Tax=Marchantia polymorpha TaxID=3197 RepID=A0AAF6BKT9_MARPO|nr:hypothetical protein MARPO_0106s0038 [Marchantia polymorpha]PTQ31850.1 hypothetical protein MARPO_0106s0038 [Marchantia polymorpha]BBN12623.1 hypothetical protein Mp_5g21610 [Marchantia polymorpha subsp. ruderalis]BBN12624.1 hypothetical protein Mp_5g21610 [Marchantia polymorpha subsp. ruderalis]|eukprot:PTQ31848.1 hypothetical protein MARPO_0106s0038 [Marchantia polymorpha]
MERSNNTSSPKEMIPERKSGLSHHPTYAVTDVFSDRLRAYDVQDAARWRGLHESTPRSLQGYKVRGVWAAKTQYDYESQGSPSSGRAAPPKSGFFKSFKDCKGPTPLHTSRNRSGLERPENRLSYVSDRSWRAGIGEPDEVFSTGCPFGTGGPWSWALVLGPDSSGMVDEPQSTVDRRARGVRGRFNEETKYDETRDPRLQNYGSRTTWSSSSRDSSHDIALRSGSRKWAMASTYGELRNRSPLPETAERQIWWKPSAYIVDPEPECCPICMEELDETDSSFCSCSCGFKLCLFCHHKIAAEDGRCPGCRSSYVRPEPDHKFKSPGA